MSVSDPELAIQISQFSKLFKGFPTAYGTGAGGWVHKPPTISEYATHVMGKGPGLGIGPLLPDNKCWFAAIDLDRPDFDLAQQLMKFLPGVSWLERSRSGNAHVLVFFSDPIEAWVTRGIMREALAAFGERSVEVFPKSDLLLPSMVGSYLNLPYYGNTRKVIAWKDDKGLKSDVNMSTPGGMPFAAFVKLASNSRNDPAEWRKRAIWLGVPSPQEREQTKTREFGNSPNLHKCAAYIIENRDDNPITEGHRAAVFFSLAKMLANWSEIDSDEALSMMALVNDASPDPIPGDELKRIFANAERGGFTSTGCDDPLVLPYRDPTCKIGER